MPNRRVCLPEFESYETNATAPNAAQTAVAAHATIHTKGNWVSLLDPTAEDTYLLEATFRGVGSSGADSGMLVDIGTGPTGGGSEVVLIANLNAGHGYSGASAGIHGQVYLFPVFIPKGVRISARAQALITADVVQVAIRAIGGARNPFWSGRTVETLGAVTASSQGTTVVSGVSSAEGAAWTDLGITTIPGRYLAVGIAGLDNALTANILMVDVGWSDDGLAWTALSENHHITTLSSETMILSFPIQIWRAIPVGKHIGVRISHDTAGAESYDAIAYVVG